MNSIKEIRQLTGLSQVKFAERYGIPVQTIKSWESNPDSTTYRPTPAYIISLLGTVVGDEIKLNDISAITDEINALLGQYAQSDGYNLSLDEANKLIKMVLEISVMCNN